MRGFTEMRNQRGLSLIELIVGITILSIVIATLFTLFSTSYKVSAIEKSKLFINSQEKIITFKLNDEINKVQEWGSIQKINRNETYNWNDIKNEIEFYYINSLGTREKIKIGPLRNCLMIRHELTDSNEPTYTEPCIRDIRFWADNTDPRYVAIRIIMFDPNNPDFPDYIYQKTFYAQNLQRM